MKKNDNYITLTEMAEGFSEYNLPQTDKCRDFVAYIDDGNLVKFTFHDCTHLTYESLGDKFQDSEKVEYIATEPAENVLYLSYTNKHGHMLSWVLDLRKEIATLVYSIFPSDEKSVDQNSPIPVISDELPIFKRVMNGQTAYTAKPVVHHCSLNKPYTKDTLKHEFTTELAGKNATYTYSEKDAYVHTYYDVDLFTWYCFSGNEAGLGETDYVKFLKIAEDLYLILWVEKILHVVSTIVLNFRTNRTSGSMASYEGKDYKGKILNVPSGALIELVDGINVTKLKPVKLK
ncbi:hypothetical protein FQS96_14360 [Enterococcus faecalis]|uniref:MoaF C-terminal domain-containing protein n=1 Tax=Enterococcus TaxID=1350 RepID=UPI001A96F64B|nr:MoaF C-terminal domain-containing protein [Enterococcus faecalis]MBO1126620.1 hypothetical protein [Enterococcus faecalis]